MAKSLGWFWGCLIFFLGLSGLKAQEILPDLGVHPLPVSLEQWSDPVERGDYLLSLTSTPVGALLWSEFPIKLYWDQPLNSDNSAAGKRFDQWARVVEQAVGEWAVYLPLSSVPVPELADIVVKRSPPPLGSQFNPETGKLEIPPARSAQTRYEIFWSETIPSVLRHRMTINISPDLSESLLLSASRHELGHALGIWGHSPSETDALYFSQVRNSPPISPRDINTLKKVYQQPTRLGWPHP